MRKSSCQVKALYCMILFSVILFVAVPGFYPGEDLAFDTEDTTPFNEGWTYVAEDGREENVVLPAVLPASASGEVCIRARLPEHFVRGMSIGVRTPHQSLRVMIDGEEIYSRGADPGLYLGKSPGSSWNLVRVPEGMEGREITMLFRSPYRDFAGRIGEIAYGSKSSLIFDILHLCAGDFLISFLLFILGVALLLFYLVTRNMKIRDRSMLYLAWFAVLTGLWMMGESKFMQFLTGDQFLITQLSIVCSMLFPIPLLFYAAYYILPKHRWVPRLLTGVFTVNFVLNMALQLLEIQDFYETVRLTQACMVLMIGALLTVLAVEITVDHSKKAKKIAVPAAVLCIFGVLELITFDMDRGMICSFFRTGMLVFMLLLGLQSFKEMGRLNEEIRKARYYEELAYVDLLTGAKNRNAYYREARRLFRENGPGPSACLLMFDLNDLKKINDRHGHVSGDRALKECCRCIETAFGGAGECYRIGGDEFACLCMSLSEERLRAAGEEFRRAVSETAAKLPFPFNVAMGCAMYDEEEDKDFESWVKRADARLYEDKSRLKGDSGLASASGEELFVEEAGDEPIGGIVQPDDAV